MNEDTKGVQNEAEVQLSQESTPDSEAQEAVQTPVETQTVQTVDETDMADLPQGDKAKEAFIKQRQIIAEQKRRLEELESERQRLAEEQSVLDQLRGSYPQQTNYDPITPDTDLDTVTQRITQTEQASQNAYQKVAELEKRLEDERLYREFPELNPESEEYKKPENKQLEKFIAGQYLIETIQSGKKPDIVKIAKQAKEQLASLTQGQKQQIATEALAEMRRNEEATLEARGTSVVQPKQIDVEDLRDRVRRGDESATIELLKNTVLR